MTMAESTLDEAQTAPVQDKLINNHNNNNNNNNNHPMVANHNHRPGLVKQRKRKRLSQVLDKLTGAKDEETKQNLCNNNNNINNNNNNNNNDDEMNNLKNKKLYPSNNNNNNNVDASVFKFDNLLNNNNNIIIKQQNEEEDVFSPASSSNKSPHSSTESPRISFSPLRIKDSPSPPLLLHHQQPHRPPICPCYQCAVSGSTHQHQHHHHHFQHPPSPLHHPYDRFFPASSPIAAPSSSSSPPAPNYNFERYLHSKYLPDIFRRRSHSDSDLPLWLEKNQIENKPSSSWCHHHQVPLPIISSSVIINNETTEIPSTQEFPLDLSMKNKSAATFVKNSSSREKKVLPPSSSSSSSSVAPHQLLPSGFLPPRGSSSSSVSVSVVKGDVASPTTKESVATRYNLEVSPVVEEMPPGSDVAFVCPVCGQMFSLHDRLAKHMASRHKSRQNASEQTAKAYLCDVCKRSFARSDMLTRHMRLHTGIKPYTCRVCGQVFSRSDHLSTHQRTHTGEKPYKCPQCPYAACRRDMITRHMRTHTRYEPDNLNTSVKTEINH